MHTYVMRCLRGPEPKVLLLDIKPFTRLTNFAHIRIHIELSCIVIICNQCQDDAGVTAMFCIYRMIACGGRQQLIDCCRPPHSVPVVWSLLCICAFGRCPVYNFAHNRVRASKVPEGVVARVALSNAVS